ncbi:MAG: DUF3179 domain-containing protein [Bacteroidia bacterium]
MNRLFFTFLCLIALFADMQSQTKLFQGNGFDYSDSSVPPEEIKAGGPGRDGIPSIDYPLFVPANKARYMMTADRVLAIEINGVAKAYPVKILNYHEVVNDTVGGQAVVITYCPLCGSGMAFNAHIKGERFWFGVSGLLYNSDVLLYDRRSQSLWSQIESEAVSGPLKGTKLEYIPTHNTSWQDWRAQHPEGQVLSTETGYQRDYRSTPYEGYEFSKELIFGVDQEDDRFARKEKIIGININGQAKAYSLRSLKKQKQAIIEDEFQGQALQIHYDAKAKSARITDAAGNLVPSVQMYWFAWYAFHPQTEVFGM